MPLLGRIRRLSLPLPPPPAREEEAGTAAAAPSLRGPRPPRCRRPRPLIPGNPKEEEGGAEVEEGGAGPETEEGAAEAAAAGAGAATEETNGAGCLPRRPPRRPPASSSPRARSPSTASIRFPRPSPPGGG